MTMNELKNFINRVKPVILMVIVMVIFSGMSILYKVASNDVMSLRILIAYRFIFATAFMLPIALYIERNTRPKLTWMVLFQAFCCALFGGSMAQNLYAESLILTSVTHATAIINLIPATTFILAIIFGLEKLVLRTRAGKAKVIGTLIAISGAMVLTFYKGPQLKVWSTQSHYSLHNNNNSNSNNNNSNSNIPHSHFIGILLALACVISNAISLIVQARLSKLYPCHYSSTALITFMGSIQASVYALCTEQDWAQWKLGWNRMLLIVLYAGVVASALAICTMMYCMKMRGPLFVSSFNPFLLVCAAIGSSLFLKEKLYFGCLIGGVAIIAGLYMVIWGKQKETKRASSSKLALPSTRVDGLMNEEQKDVNVANNVVAVAPNFVVVSEMEEEEEEEEEEEIEIEIESGEEKMELEDSSDGEDCTVARYWYETWE